MWNCRSTWHGSDSVCHRRRSRKSETIRRDERCAFPNSCLQRTRGETRVGEARSVRAKCNRIPHSVTSPSLIWGFVPSSYKGGAGLYEVVYILLAKCTIFVEIRLVPPIVSHGICPSSLNPCDVPPTHTSQDPSHKPQKMRRVA